MTCYLVAAGIRSHVLGQDNEYQHDDTPTAATSITNSARLVSLFI
jgi:hypothetical protein